MHRLLSKTVKTHRHEAFPVGNARPVFRSCRFSRLLMLGALLPLMALAACGGPDIEAEVVEKQEYDNGGTIDPHKVCHVHVRVTNNGSSPVERLQFILRDGDRSSSSDGTSRGIAIGESKTFNLAFNRTACGEITESLELSVQSCVAGGADCSNALAFR